MLDLQTLRQFPPNDDLVKEVPPGYTCAYPLDDLGAQQSHHQQSAASAAAAQQAATASAQSSSSASASSSLSSTPSSSTAPAGGALTKGRGTSGSFGYPSAVFKVVSTDDGQTYALRRVDAVKTTHHIVSDALDKWRGVRHPSIISLYHMSLQHHRTLIVCHAYIPGAVTLKQVSHVMEDAMCVCVSEYVCVHKQGMRSVWTGVYVYVCVCGLSGVGVVLSGTAFSAFLSFKQSSSFPPLAPLHPLSAIALHRSSCRCRESCHPPADTGTITHTHQ